MKPLQWLKEKTESWYLLEKAEKILLAAIVTTNPGKCINIAENDEYHVRGLEKIGHSIAPDTPEMQALLVHGITC